MNSFPTLWSNEVPRHVHWLTNYQQKSVHRDLDAPLIVEATEELHANYDVEPMLPLLSILDAASISCSYLWDVEAPGYPPCPITTYTWKVVGVAAGKSLVHEAVFRSTQKLQRESNEQYEAALSEFHAQEAIWEEKHRSKRQALAKQERIRESSELEERSLAEHVKHPPAKPRCEQFIFEDSTGPAFHWAVYSNGGHAFLGGPEGATVIKSDVFNEPQKLNKYFSGEAVRNDRKNGESYTSENARVTIGLALQDGAHKNFLASKRGQSASETGLLSRLLVCDATNYRRQPQVSVADKFWPALGRLHERQNDLMRQTLAAKDAGSHKRRVLRFSPAAAAKWGEARYQIELRRAPHQMYQHAPDHAARLPEIIARLAALIHIFEGKHGDVDLGSLEAAMVIAGRSSEDYLKLFVPMPQEYQDAQSILRMLEKFKQRNIVLFDRSYLRSMNSGMRNAGRYDLALAVLYREGQIFDAQDCEGTPCLCSIPPHLIAYPQYAYGKKRKDQSRYLP